MVKILDYNYFLMSYYEALSDKQETSEYMKGILLKAQYTFF